MEDPSLKVVFGLSLFILDDPFLEPQAQYTPDAVRAVTLEQTQQASHMNVSSFWPTLKAPF